MGHTLVDPDTAYHRLQERLDRMPTGAPDSPVFQRILRLLFTADEAELAAQIPTMGSLAQVARRTGRTEAELDPIVTDLARRGPGDGLPAPRPPLRRAGPRRDRVLRVHLHAGPRRRPDGGARPPLPRVHVRRRRLRPRGLPREHPDRPIARPRGVDPGRSVGRGARLGAGHPHRGRGPVGGRLAVPVPRAREAGRRGLRRADPHLPDLRRRGGRARAGGDRRADHATRRGWTSCGWPRRPASPRPRTTSSTVSATCATAAAAAAG